MPSLAVISSEDGFCSLLKRTIMKKLVYLAPQGYKMTINVILGTNEKIINDLPFEVQFSFEERDPYFGYDASWTEEDGKYRWLYTALCLKCLKPSDWETRNRVAVAPVSERTLQGVIETILDHWLTFHKKRAQALQTLEKL